MRLLSAWGRRMLRTNDHSAPEFIQRSAQFSVVHVNSVHCFTSSLNRSLELRLVGDGHKFERLFHLLAQVLDGFEKIGVDDQWRGREVWKVCHSMRETHVKIFRKSIGDTEKLRSREVVLPHHGTRRKLPLLFEFFSLLPVGGDGLKGGYDREEASKGSEKVADLAMSLRGKAPVQWKNREVEPEANVDRAPTKEGYRISPSCKPPQISINFSHSPRIANRSVTLNRHQGGGETGTLNTLFHAPSAGFFDEPDPYAMAPLDDDWRGQ